MATCCMDALKMAVLASFDRCRSTFVCVVDVCIEDVNVKAGLTNICAGVIIMFDTSVFGSNYEDFFSSVRN
jgi:hypothetical protein